MSRLIAAEIRKQLFLRDMTGTQLGERAGMTQPYISRRLTGATAFDVDDLQKIADVLGVDIADLLPKPAYRDERASRGISPDYRRPAPRPRSAHLIDVAHRDRTAESGSVPATKSARVTGPRSRPSWADAGGAA